MQVTEKPKTVCVECQYYKQNCITITHTFPLMASWKEAAEGYFPPPIELTEQRILGIECISPQHTIYNTVTGKHTIDPEKKNDGNCPDYEPKAPTQL